MFPTSVQRVLAGVGLLVLFGAIIFACQSTGSSQSSTADAAQKVYVPPGEKDDFYAFMSGGYSGQLTVYGLPSGRHLKTVGVFSQFAETGYGYTPDTEAMFQTSHGFVPWGDAHHPELSQTDGVPDGRWIFMNENNTPRIARIDLTTFETTEIIEIPNSAGNHASSFVTPNTEYVTAATRFSIPMDEETLNNQDVSIDSYEENFKGTISFIRADEPGEMEVSFQIQVPGFDYDLSHSGKGPSNGWAFFTSYNSEQAHTMLEKNASRNDKDFIAAVNWERAEEYANNGECRMVEGEHAHNYYDHETGSATSEMRDEVCVLNPVDNPGMVYFLPTPKSPHGVDVDPTGQYIVAGGKLSTVIPVHSFAKMEQAIENESFADEIQGIPVLNYEEILHGEVENPGLGPLHTEFDGEGNAYTTAFISSEIVKWDVENTQVLDRIDTYYSPGHLMIPGGDSQEPWGQYVIALNKITKDRYLPTGPELAHSAQLIDISGDKMQLLLDFPTMGEPHYAQALPADLIQDKQKQVYDLKTDNQNPRKVMNEDETRVEREGNEVHIYMSAIRSHFVPDNIEGVQVGDEVYFHVTNLEQDWDVPHGFAVKGANTAELLIMPGQTETLKWTPQKVGVFPFYCTDFCSALHQEMQGYVRVSPEGSDTPLASNAGQAKAGSNLLE